jgi:hypothetical protein
MCPYQFDKQFIEGLTLELNKFEQIYGQEIPYELLIEAIKRHDLKNEIYVCINNNFAREFLLFLYTYNQDKNINLALNYAVNCNRFIELTEHSLKQSIQLNKLSQPLYENDDCRCIIF